MNWIIKMIGRIKEINWRKNLKDLVNLKLELNIYYSNSRDLGTNRRKKKIREIIIKT